VDLDRLSQMLDCTTASRSSPSRCRLCGPRLDDVAEVAHYFLFRFNRELGLDFRGFAPETLERFQGYAWPGNVRELQSAIKQAMLNASGHLVLPEFLPENLALKPETDQHVSEAAGRLGAAFDLRALIEKCWHAAKTASTRS